MASRANEEFERRAYQKTVIRAILELTFVPLQLALLENLIVHIYLPTKGNRLWRNQTNFSANYTIKDLYNCQSYNCRYCNITDWSFSHDVAAAMLVIENNETAAILVNQANPVGVQLFYYVNTFFCSNTLAWLLVAHYVCISLVVQL